MIQVYSPNNTNFNKNGNAVIFPVECNVSAEINGPWILELFAPIDEEDRWKLLEVNAVIKAPSFNGEQLFRIRQSEKKDSGISVTAEPIFMDAVGDCFILDVRPTNKNGQQALDDILSPNSKYSGRSDITATNTAYFIRKNAIEAIAGGEDVSFLSRWGGEILFNNYEIIINNRIGGDYGVQLLYGKNIPVDGLIETVNMEGVVTRILPKAYNGITLPGNSPWIDSPIINAYPTVYTSVMDFENIRLASDVDGENPEEGVIVCDTLEDVYAALTAAANEQFESGIDKPLVSIDADMVLLANTEEYKEFRDLEKVSLGDTIHLKHKRLGIISEARIVSLVYDSIRDITVSVTIGAVNPSFLDRVASTVTAVDKAINKNGTVKAEQINGFIDGAYAQLRIQNTVARRQEARAIFFEDLDPSSPTFGALSIGTQGWQISKERTADDRDWIWTTAATSGGIIADTINAGTLEAIDIQGVNITGSAISGNTISGGTISGSAISGNTITGGTISGTNINGNTISGGTISGTTITGTTISGNEVTSSGAIDSGSGLSDTLVMKGGYYHASRDLGNNKNRESVLNSDYLSVRQNTGTTIDSYATLDFDELKISDAYFWQISGAAGKIQGEKNGVKYIADIPNGLVKISSGTSNDAIMDAVNKVFRVTDGTKIARYYNDHIEMYNGSTFTWGSEYKPGLRVEYGLAAFSGHITNAGKWIDFFVPLNISAEGRTVSVTLPSQLSVRGINGYVGGTQYPTWSVTTTGTCLKNGIMVRLASTTAYTNATNNTPVTVYGDFTFVFLT